MSNWRACHYYPINTFQAALRAKLRYKVGNAIISQRLKRSESIIQKLIREPKMTLDQMHDIGGLRAVLPKVADVEELCKSYKNSKRLTHTLFNEYDYVTEPKTTGYRGIHLVYKYVGARTKTYDGLRIELQIRTRLQHAWATAVETMGLFLNSSLKASEGPGDWLDFFSVVSAAFCHLESCPIASDYKDLSKAECYAEVTRRAEQLDAVSKLGTFTGIVQSLPAVTGGSVHLVVLDVVNKTVEVQTFGKNRIAEANDRYADYEKQARDGKRLQAVLVSTDTVENLRRAYPSFFLDTKEFVRNLKSIIDSQ